jgi:polyhydroxybutyrate depolymerase
MLAKIKKWFIELILITLAISGCTRSAPVNVSSLDNGEKSGKGFSLLPEGLLKKSVELTPPGDYIKTINVEGETLEAAKTRSYGLHVPASYDGSIAVPLVIMLHGNGANSGSFASLTGIMSSSDSTGFLAVYPDAYGVPPGWNPGFITGNGANDVAFISELIDHFLVNFNVDTKRVYVIGYSEGGMMAHQLASSIPEKIAGIGVVGGTIGYQKSAEEKVALQGSLAPVSVMIIHGAQDTEIPYKVTNRLLKGKEGYLPASDSVEYWVKQNQCDPNGDLKVTKNENVRTSTFSCINGTVVKSISIWNNGHSWPGATEKSSAKKAKMDYPATYKLLEFLFTQIKN